MLVSLACRMWLVSLSVRASLIALVTLVVFALLEIRVVSFYSEVVNHLVGALRLSTFHSPHDLMFRDYMLPAIHRYGFLLSIFILFMYKAGWSWY